ncbi:MAG: transporter permease, partial [Noviherbaspirillum sp.]|nr:transporter permease [Noviherbaspirillum sp.]
MNPYIQGLYSGLMNGATYALLGIGLVLVYRTSRILNLAHGETFTISAAAVVLLGQAGLPLWGSVPIAVLISLLLYCALERFALQPRRQWPVGTLILITLGAAFLVRGVLFLLIGTDPVSFAPIFAGAPLRFAGGVMPRQGAALV